MTLPLLLLVAHFIGDFFLQSDWMALNKSKRWEALYLHCLVYAMCFSPWGYRFIWYTFAFHFLTDAVTSRITSKLWFIELTNKVTDGEYGTMYDGVWVVARKRHWFFVAIGLDQLIHYITLAFTYHLLIGG